MALMVRDGGGVVDALRFSDGDGGGCGGFFRSFCCSCFQFVERDDGDGPRDGILVGGGLMGWVVGVDWVRGGNVVRLVLRRVRDCQGKLINTYKLDIFTVILS
jgi:hypothetical protein